MAGKNDPDPDPKKKKNGEGEDDGDEWTPDKPLDDAEQEEEANTRARAHARYEFLKDQHKKKLEEASDPKKKKGEPGKKKSLW